MSQASPAEIEEVYKQAVLLEHTLRGILADVADDHAHAEAEIFPVWELAGDVTKRLRNMLVSSTEAGGEGT